MNILETIVLEKHAEVARLPARPTLASDLSWTVSAFGARRNFWSALLHPPNGRIALIAEVKKASPSAGVIRADFDPVQIALAYEAGGASCLSVLTDEKFFQGSLQYLRQIRDAVRLPLLRKDFIISPRQILESIEWGADAILLIAAILDDQQMTAFLRLAEDCGLAALVEVHDENELSRALAAGARLIGVNNRDLKTFKVDLATTERLGARVKREPGRLLVAESGIHTPADVDRLYTAGARAILVGESLMRQGDIQSKVRELLAP